MTLRQLAGLLDSKIAPFALQEPWDNSGLLAGDPDAEVACALVCLDITRETVDEALRRGATALISHHPVIFHPLKAVLADSVVYRLVQSGLGAVCSHTCLDCAEGGVSDCLARALELSGIGPLSAAAREGDGAAALGRIGTLPHSMAADELGAFIVRKLSPAGGVRYSDAGGRITRVAVCGGAGGSLAALARACGAQALITGEVEHDVFVDHTPLGLSLFDAGHADTERIVLPALRARLSALAPETQFLLSDERSLVRLAAAPQG